MGGLLGIGCYVKSSTALVLKSLSRLHTTNLSQQPLCLCLPDSHGLMAYPLRRLEGRTNLGVVFDQHNVC